MESTYFQKRIALLEQLGSKESLDEVIKTIKALSFYLTESNPAYFYNESYLNDLTLNFVNVLRKLQVRRKIANALFLEASEWQLFGANLLITVDNIWEIQLSDNKFEVMKEGSLEYLLGKKCFIRAEFEFGQSDVIIDSYLFEPEKIRMEDLVDKIREPLERRPPSTDDAKNEAL